MSDAAVKGRPVPAGQNISLGTKSLVLSANTSLSLSTFTEGLSVKGYAAPVDMYFFGASKSTAQTSVTSLTKVDREGEAISNMGVFIADKDLAILRSIIKRVDVHSIQDNANVNQVPHDNMGPIQLGAALVHRSPSASSGAIGVMMVLVFGSLLIIGAITNSVLINPAIGYIIIIFGASFVAMQFSSSNHVES